MPEINLIVLKAVLFFLFASCTNETEKTLDPDRSDVLRDGYVTHPVEEKMPHYEVEPTEIEINADLHKATDLPEILKLLNSFLDDASNTGQPKALTLLTSDQDNFYAESIDDEVLAILDPIDNRFVHYQITGDEELDSAPQGRGPGDIAFAREMQKHKDRLYISMQGFRISIFNCREAGACEYERTINTEFNNYSVALGENQLTVLGLLPFGRDGDPDPTKVNQYAIHQVNNQGDIEKSFSPVYQDRLPNIRDKMSGNGMMRFFENAEVYTVMYQWIPYIYLYDADTEFKEKIEIPGFKQGLYDWHEGDRLGRERYHKDNTFITHQRKLMTDGYSSISGKEKTFIGKIRFYIMMKPTSIMRYTSMIGYYIK